MYPLILIGIINLIKTIYCARLGLDPDIGEKLIEKKIAESR